MGDINSCQWLIGLLLMGWLLPSAPAVARQAPAAIVIDANTGSTLHAAAADARRYPASLTKMMTIYLIFEHLKQGRLTLSTPIRFSQRAANQQPSKLGLKVGETITVKDAISALITKSANDVATAVAEHIAGSEIAFARLMTAKARALGMSRTVYQNASGLPDKSQVTTARDMARLGLALQDDFPKRYRMFAQRRFAYRGRRYKNHNRLLGRFPGTDGIKTGYTRASGFNITTSVRRDGKHLIGVVIGQRTGRVRDTVMRNLLVKALRKASAKRTRPRPSRAPAQLSRPQLVAQPRPLTRPRPFVAGRSAAKPVRRAEAGPVAELAPRRRRIERSRPTRNAVGRQAQVRQPSTFGAQVARLNERAQPTLVRRTRVAAPERRPAQRKRTTHQVQIGAFFSDAEARDALASAQQRAGTILHGFQAVSVKVSAAPRPIYRARFAGFDSTQAAATCSKLKTVRVDCFVTRSN